MNITEILNGKKYYIVQDSGAKDKHSQTTVTKGLFNRKKIKDIFTTKYYTIYKIYLQNSVSPAYPVLTAKITNTKGLYDFEYEIAVDTKPIKTTNAVANAIYTEVKTMYYEQEEKRDQEIKAEKKAALEKSKQVVYNSLQSAVRDLVK